MIVIASDHAGVALKRAIVARLEARGEPYRDLGTSGDESVDYPDFAHAVAAEISGQSTDRGILVCGTGIGMSMAANRHRGVRAALCHDRTTAEMARRHNDANVLCLGARILPEKLALQLVDLFIDTPFEGDRHQRRIQKIEPAQGDRHE